MKKFMSITLVIIGIASAMWVVFTVYNFGAANMRRVDRAAYEYHLNWADRR